MSQPTSYRPEPRTEIRVWMPDPEAVPRHLRHLPGQRVEVHGWFMMVDQLTGWSDWYGNVPSMGAIVREKFLVRPKTP